MLRFDGEIEGVALAELVASPEPFEQVEAELVTQRFFDDRALSLTRPGGAGLHGPQYLGVESHCRPNLWHLCIMASEGLAVVGSFLVGTVESSSAVKGRGDPLGDDGVISRSSE